MSMVVKVWLSLLLMATFVYGSYSLVRVVRQRAELAEEEEIPAPAKDLYEFTFTGADGKPFDLAELKGKVWVGSFFFAQCPGFCRQLNQSVAHLADELKDDDVTFVSFSVDPVNDTPERLAEYAQSFKADPARWKFLVSDLANTHALGQGVFKVTVMGQEHTDRLVLIDAQGRIRGTYRFQEELQMQAFRKQLKKVLAEDAAGSKS